MLQLHHGTYIIIITVNYHNRRSTIDLEIHFQTWHFIFFANFNSNCDVIGHTWTGLMIFVKIELRLVLLYFYWLPRPICYVF